MTHPQTPGPPRSFGDVAHPFLTGQFKAAGGGDASESSPGTVAPDDVVAAALRENVERFRQLAHALPGMLWLAGPDGGRTFVNQPWLEFTGRGAETELGTGWMAGVHESDRHSTQSAVRVAIEARVPFEV